MAIDMGFGYVEKFEDFLVTAVADLPEIDVQSVTGDTAAVVASGADGRLRHSVSTSNDDDVGATTFGALNWVAGRAPLWMQARFFLSSVTDCKVFIGFGDSIATADETSFDATSDVVDILTMTDGFGLLFDNDSTTKQVWAVAGNTDVKTVGYGLGTSSWSNITINTAQTWGCELSSDRLSARFYLNGKEVYSVTGASALVGAVALVPGVWAYEQGTAYNLDLDYLAVRNGRSTT